MAVNYRQVGQGYRSHIPYRGIAVQLPTLGVRALHPRSGWALEGHLRYAAARAGRTLRT